MVDSVIEDTASAASGSGQLPQEESVFARLLEANKQTFFELLRSFDGAKAVVWDPDLIKRINIIASVAELKRQRVNHMYKLEKKQAVPECDVEHLLFISEPLTSKAELIADMIRLGRPGDHRRNHVLFVPTGNELCIRKLKEANLGDRLSSVKEIPIYFYSREADVASMEMGGVLKDFLIDENWAPLHTVMKCLDNIESVLGEPNKVCYKGEWASRVFQMLQKKRHQDRLIKKSNDAEGTIITKAPLIDTVVLLDRWIDPVTPLFSQLTYEGLIDELYGISCGVAKFPADRFVQDNAVADGSGDVVTPFDEKAVPLNDSNEVYRELRDLHVNAVGTMLNRRLKQIVEEKEEFKRTKDTKSVREIKEFVKRLKNELQSAEKAAETHFEIVCLVKEAIAGVEFNEIANCEQGIIMENFHLDKPLVTVENLIAKAESLHKVLRLICLQSLTCDGLKPKVLEQYRKDILQSFGYQHLPTLINLQRTGLLREKGTTAITAPGAKPAIPPTYSRMTTNGQVASTFEATRRTFRLLIDNVSETAPNDPSYVYSGYCPLTIRLCEYLLSPGWPAILDQLARLPGPTGVEGKVDNVPLKAGVAGGNSKKLVLVFFIGGVTFAEISALRYLSRKEDGCKFLVATTHMLTGDLVMKSLEYY